MTRRRINSFWRDESGAVAAVYAVGLVGLVAIAGVGYDYTRMAGLDSELQNGADQAALAGATQLDGESGACARAGNAASGMLRNITLLANDNAGNDVTVNSGGTIGVDDDQCASFSGITFYQDKDKTTVATTDADAKFIQVAVGARTAKYAFTPIVGALSATMNAKALAGVGEAICRVPPVMMCNPAEGTDDIFDVENYVGDGFHLISHSTGGYTPGDFGFLEANAGNGSNVLGQELGRQVQPGDCIAADDVTTEPGNMVSVRDALNTRLGIYNSVNSYCGSGGTLCPPSANIRQDLVLNGTGNTLNKLGFVTNSGPGNGWEEALKPYPASSLIGTSHRDLTQAEIAALDPMGYPEDECHAFSASGTYSCTNGKIGDGNWDRFAYFRTNTASYPEVASLTTADTATFNNLLTGWFDTTTPTRFQVYQWEMDNASTRLLQQTANTGRNAYSNPSNLTGEPGSVSPNANTIDRRVFSVAVINCQAEGINGKTSGVKVQKWVDVFLVQPSVPRTVGTRTDNSDVYVEIIGETKLGGGGTTSQTVSKAKPYLIQ